MRALTLSFLCLPLVFAACSDSMPISNLGGGTLTIDGGPRDASSSYDGGSGQDEAGVTYDDAGASDAAAGDAGSSDAADASEDAAVDCEAEATAEWTLEQAATSTISDVVVRITGSLESSEASCVEPDGGCPDAGDCCLSCSATLHVGEVEVISGACAPHTGCSGQRCGDWEMISCSPPTGPGVIRGRIERDDAGVRLELYGLD